MSGNIKRRLADAEKALDIADGDACKCVGQGPGTGIRLLWRDDPLERPEDTEEVCRVCGKPRLTIEIVWVKQWPPGGEHE